MWAWKAGARETTKAKYLLLVDSEILSSLEFCCTFNAQLRGGSGVLPSVEMKHWLVGSQHFWSVSPELERASGFWVVTVKTCYMMSLMLDCVCFSW